MAGPGGTLPTEWYPSSLSSCDNAGLRILECLAISLDADPSIFTRSYDQPLGRCQLFNYSATREVNIRADRFGTASPTD